MFYAIKKRNKYGSAVKCGTAGKRKCGKVRYCGVKGYAVKCGTAGQGVKLFSPAVIYVLCIFLIINPNTEIQHTIIRSYYLHKKELLVTWEIIRAHKVQDIVSV